MHNFLFIVFLLCQPIIHFKPLVYLQELNVFNMVLRDVFYGLPKPPAPAFHITKVVQDFETVLLAHTREKGFVPHQPWIAKIHQLWTLSKVHRGYLFLKILVR